MNDTQDLELQLVLNALVELKYRDSIWTRNHSIFWNMSPEQRARWWYFAKKNADAGVVSMQTLLLKVIELRLKK